MRNFKEFSEFEKSALRFLDQIMRDMEGRPGAYENACFTHDDLVNLIEYGHAPQDRAEVVGVSRPHCPRCNAYMHYLEHGKVLSCPSCHYVMVSVGA